jgi:peptidoglycan hydrolase-like protein with peptidoglycan-binding domain
VAVVAAVVAVAAAASGAAMTAGRSAAQDGTVATPTLPTEPLARRDLVVTETFTGELAYAGLRTLTTGRAGTVTTMAPTGAVVTVGAALYSIDLEPAVLLVGAIPAFRALDVDVSDGPDVRQLEQALAVLGYGTDLTVDDHFSSVTAAAVARWETDLGRAEPDGVVELGDVVFSSGDVRVSEVLAAVGSRVQQGGAVLAVTSTGTLVTLDLDVNRADDVETGTMVALTLPGGVASSGTISSIGTQPEVAPNDPSATATVPVEITLDEPAATGQFDSGSVDVALERSREDRVLAAPVTALLALAEGGYALEVVDGTGASHLVGVTIGTIADGYVAVTGDGVAAGVSVVVPS